MENGAVNSGPNLLPTRTWENPPKGAEASAKTEKK